MGIFMKKLPGGGSLDFRAVAAPVGLQVPLKPI
jgi:hypothetical protein